MSKLKAVEVDVDEGIKTTKPIIHEPGFVVTRALLHQAFPIPKGDTATSMHASKGINMRYCPDGLYCENKGLRFIIPLANVIGVYV